MLQFIRSRVTSIFIKILFVLLIASFAVWGIGDIFLGSPGGRAAVKVGDAEWNSVEVMNQFDRVRRRLPAGISAQQAVELGLLDSVLEQMVNEGLFAAEGKELSLGAGEQVIRQRIANSPAFRDSTGRFSPETFRQTLYNAGLSEEEYVAALRNEVARDQVVGAATAGVAVPGALTKTLFGYRHERRTADVVVIRADEIKNVKQPTDSDLHAFYKENATDYEAPEYRRVTYLALAPADLASEILIAEDAIQDEYDARLDQYVKKASRDVDQILFLEEAEAKTASERIKAGEDFAAVALDITGSDADSLKLGNVLRGELLEETQEPVFSAPVGGITDPVQSDLGWHIFRVNAANEESVAPLAEVKDEIKRDLAQERALDAIFELANTLEDELAAGSTIEEAASAVNVKPKSIAALDPRGRDEQGNTVEGLPSDAAFLTAASETAKGQQSKVVETREGTYFVLRVDEVTAPAVRPLDKVRDQVRADWREDRQRDAALKQAEAVRKSVKDGAKLSTAARQIGLAVTRVGPFTRDGGGIADGLPADLAGLAFELKLGDADLMEDEVQSVVIVPVEETKADVGKLDKALARVDQEVLTGMQNDIVHGLMQGLRQRHEVVVDRAYIDSVLREDQ